MQIEESNKIIAEFMGLEFLRIRDDFFFHGDDLMIPENNETHILYSRSLDALVPVWEKLKEKNIGMDVVTARCFVGADIPPTRAESIQEATCIATAKAIKDL